MFHFLFYKFVYLFILLILVFYVLKYFTILLKIIKVVIKPAELSLCSNILKMQIESLLHLRRRISDVRMQR